MTKTCSELFQGMDCTIIGNGNEEVAGLAFRSDEVAPGDMFFCIVGTVVDGHSFIPVVSTTGVAAIVCEQLPQLLESGITYIKVENSAVALGHLASEWYGNPSRELKLVGVTGTNGKTTTATLIYDCLLYTSDAADE